MGILKAGPAWNNVWNSNCIPIQCHPCNLSALRTLHSLPHLPQVWLQEFAWTEREIENKKEERSSSLPPGTDTEQLNAEPIWCFEVRVGRSVGMEFRGTPGVEGMKGSCGVSKLTFLLSPHTQSFQTAIKLIYWCFLCYGMW